jgi:hypothetical protein
MTPMDIINTTKRIRPNVIDIVTMGSSFEREALKPSRGQSTNSP